MKYRYNTKWISHLCIQNKVIFSQSITSSFKKINVKNSDKYVVFSNLTIYYTWKNIKRSYQNNKFKVSAPTWNAKFQLPD